jgi:hypothetical protein
MNDADLANAVEGFYARNASYLTPENRALLANTVKLIRHGIICDLGSDECPTCAIALADAEAIARCTGSVSATKTVDNRRVGGTLHIATYIREDV